MGDDINDVLLEFRSLDPDPPEVRQKCEKCRSFTYIMWIVYVVKLYKMWGPTKHRIGRIDRIGGTLSCIFLISLFPSPHSCDACLLYLFSRRGYTKKR